MGAARVITTCSETHASFVRKLGADQVIDYHKQNYYDVLPPKSVDVVYDCVGLDGTGDHAFGIIKTHGSFVTLLQGAKASISTRVSRPDVRQYAPTCTWPS
ncbi:EO [Symbiodinium natans]|uniref:EO protein n=1 Tax=Symbiodinium natans TaxID=878477 RepID=A0A812STQ8_9DINO|nr:EO [Symbiodinium natans]